MAKYKYWHIVIDVSEEWKKKHPEFHNGMVITHQYKHDGYGVCMIDLSIPKEYPEAYTLAYLGRVDLNIKGEQLCEILKQLIIEKGHYKLWQEAEAQLSDNSG
jgi:hypothetical protein